METPGICGSLVLRWGISFNTQLFWHLENQEAEPPTRTLSQDLGICPTYP